MSTISLSLLHAKESIWKRPEVIEIFRLFPNVCAGLPAGRAPSLKELNTLAQRYFLRPLNKERHSEITKQFYINLFKRFKEQSKLLSLLPSLGMMSDNLPKRSNSNYILIHGSTVQNMRDRIMFVARLIEKGRLSSSPTIVFLSGERPLYPQETEQVILDPSPYLLDPKWSRPKSLPQDEKELSQFLWNQLKLPPRMRSLPMHIINASKEEGRTRATTRTAIQKFVKEFKNLTGYFWSVSNSPYIPYQALVTHYTLVKLRPSKEVPVVEGIGPGPSKVSPLETAELGILLDALARILYEEFELAKLNHP